MDLLPTGRPRPWIVLHAGSGDNFPGRRWPVERFAAVGERLLDARGGTLLLTGNESEMPLAAELAGRLRRRGIRAVDLSGRLQLPELIETLARQSLRR